MKPITFEFIEKPTENELDYSAIQYSNELNLSVDKTNGLPAIEFLNMDTETFTKTGGEASDSDMDIRMDTVTRTFTQLESSDSDPNLHNIAGIMGTSTLTESSEVADSDEDAR